MNSYFENVEESVDRLRYRLSAFETEILLRGVFLTIIAYASVGMALQIVYLFVNLEPKTEPEDGETDTDSSCDDDSEEYSESESDADSTGTLDITSNTVIHEIPQEVKNEPEYIQRILEDLETREASFSDISLS